MSTEPQLPQPINWTVTPAHALAAIQWACSKLNHAIDRPGMNKRGLTESLDDKIMGDMATVAVVEYLRDTLKQKAVAYDQIRTDRFQRPDPGWDVAFGPSAYRWARTTNNPAVPQNLTTISVRSSRLPRNDTLERALATRDFKVFAPPNVALSQLLTSHVELQVYYPYALSQLGQRKITRQLTSTCVSDRAACQQIADQLAILDRYGTCALAAWNDRAAIMAAVAELENPYWYAFGKRMWIAPLRFGRTLTHLAEYTL